MQSRSRKALQYDPLDYHLSWQVGRDRRTNRNIAMPCPQQMLLRYAHLDRGVAREISQMCRVKTELDRLMPINAQQTYIAIKIDYRIQIFRNKAAG